MKFISALALSLAVAQSANASDILKTVICRDPDTKKVFKGLAPMERNCDSNHRVLMNIYSFECEFSTEKIPGYCQVYTLTEVPGVKDVHDVVKRAYWHSRHWHPPTPKDAVNFIPLPDLPDFSSIF